MKNPLRKWFKKQNMNRKINLAVLQITLVITVIIGIFSYVSFTSTAINIIGNDTLKISETVAASVNGDQIEHYDKTNKTDSKWNDLCKLLNEEKTRNGAYFLYIFANDGSNYKYIAEGHVSSRNDDISALGDTDPKSIYDPKLQTVFDTGKPDCTGIYSNGQYGRLISGFSPIKNSAGKTVAVVGADISAEQALSDVFGYIPKLALLLIICEILLFILLRMILKKLIIEPLNDITVLEGNIARGNNDLLINEKYLQQTDEIGDMFNGFKSMSETYRLLLRNINNLAQQHREGNTDVFINEDDFNGIYKDVVHSINSMAQDYKNDTVKVVNYLDNISNGNFDAELARFPGQKAFINEKIDLLKANLKNITIEMKDLVTSAIDGNLEDRADLGSLNGDWKKLMQLLNSLLDAVIKPVIDSSRVLNELADGNVDVKITGEYKGSFANVKKSLTKLEAAIRNMTSDVETLAAATIDGNLTVRVDANKYNGEYKKIVEYMNNTVDAVQKPISLIKDQLDMMANGLPTDILKTDFKGTYAELIRSINALTMSISLMLDKTSGLMYAAQKGNLSFRADTNGLKGKYTEIVTSINQAMDAIIQPIEEITGVIKEVAVGNLNVKVQGDYQGSINNLKENVNLTVDTLNSIIKNISDYTENIADGNINLEALPAYSGDYIKISTSLNKIVDSLNGILNSIWQSSDKIAAGSQQIAEGGTNLSTSASEQASVVEELTASVNEIAAQTDNNAKNAEEAGKQANVAKQEAEAGDGKMGKMLKAMSEINDSSQNITKIIKTIEDIAFQTNILALNAAIEAARAGQYGKGFAVVADEVRDLAVKSANAVKNTNELIEISTEKAKQGSTVANEMSQSLKVLNSTIKKVDGLVSSIVKSSEEQACGIAQINKGIEVVSTVVQKNAATSEESAASSNELSSQAEILKKVVSKFKLKDN